MSKFIIREYYELCSGGVCEDLLTEEEKIKVRNGTVILTGKLQEADTKNGNGRVYPKPILEREIKKYLHTVSERRALGELDHPPDAVINLRKASHLVTELWWDGNNVMGKIEILGTPSGKILQELVSSGVKMGISSRSLGSVKESNGVSMVEDDLQLICFDMVSEPSTPGAFMLKEHKEIFERKEKIENILDDILIFDKR